MDQSVDVDTTAEVKVDYVLRNARQKLSAREFAFADQFFALPEGEGTALR
jgi:hypothetical protein